MQKTFVSLAALAAFGLAASAARADCSGHNVTASSKPAQETVAMSTYDGAISPVIVEDSKTATEASAEKACAEGETICESGTE